MFRIAICDDQDDSLRLIDRAVTRYFLERSDLQADISRFDNPLEFLNALHSSGGWDIVILDVCMPEVNGTEIAREIRNRHDRTEIIFISYSTEYAVEAFALNAVHYVLKPLNEKDFREAMDRAIKPFSEREKKTIMLLLANGIVQAVDIKEILYIESVAYRRLVHTSTTLYEETRKPLAKLHEELEALSPGQFILPYRGYIVNLDAIRTISTDRIIMQNGDFILIKRGDFRHLRDIFFQWSFRNRDIENSKRQHKCTKKRSIENLIVSFDLQERLIQRPHIE